MKCTITMKNERGLIMDHSLQEVIAHYADREGISDDDLTVLQAFKKFCERGPVPEPEYAIKIERVEKLWRLIYFKQVGTERTVDNIIELESRFDIRRSVSNYPHHIEYVWHDGHTIKPTSEDVVTLALCFV